jgi:hypothetical protein
MEDASVGSVSLLVAEGLRLRIFETMRDSGKVVDGSRGGEVEYSWTVVRIAVVISSREV